MIRGLSTTHPKPLLLPFALASAEHQTNADIAVCPSYRQVTQPGIGRATLKGQLQAVQGKQFQGKRKNLPQSFKNKFGQDKRKPLHKDPLCSGSGMNVKMKFFQGLNFFLFGSKDRDT